MLIFVRVFVPLVQHVAGVRQEALHNNSPSLWLDFETISEAMVLLMPCDLNAQIILVSANNIVQFKAI